MNSVKRNIFMSVCILFLPSQVLTANDEQPEVGKYPDTCQQAVDLIIENLSDEDRNLLKSINIEELKSKRYISGWGKGIRDGFGLNTGNLPLMKSCKQRREDAALHPIDISVIIMEDVWQSLR